jgi:hypothetical protein
MLIAAATFLRSVTIECFRSGEKYANPESVFARSPSFGTLSQLAMNAPKLA